MFDLLLPICVFSNMKNKFKSIGRVNLIDGKATGKGSGGGCGGADWDENLHDLPWVTIMRYRGQHARGLGGRGGG